MTRAVFLIVAIVSATLVGGAMGAAGASHEDGECSFPVTVTDATGTEVTLSEPPEEVVVADAASAQTLWEIGADDRVTGMPVRSYTAYLDGSENRTDVLTGDGSDLEPESIVELDPDLVIAANPEFFSQESIEQLRDAGLTVYQYPLEESIDDIYATTETYGHLVGECDAAGETVAEMRADVEQVREAVADRDEPRVLYYFFEFTGGEGTFVGDLVEIAGGENIAASAGIEGFQPVPDETIAERDPEWIVTTDDEDSIDTSREPIASTTAVGNDQVLVVDANLVSQPGPRVVEPLRAMAEAFHPDAFAEPTRTEPPSIDEGVTPTATPTGVRIDETEPSPTEADGVGFGAAVAVVALVAATLLARRR